MTRLLPPLLAAALVFTFAFAIRCHRTEVLRGAVAGMADGGAGGGAAAGSTDADVQPMSPDAWYYLARTVASYRGLVGDGAIMPSWEPGLSCPDGTAPPWPHGLNVGAALLARVGLGSAASPAEVRAFAAWLPPLVGALSCALLCLFGAAVFSLSVGALAGTLLALLPIHVWNTAYSTLDHHIFAALFPLLALWAIRHGANSGRLGGWLAAGALLGVSHWCWTETWFWQAVLVGVALLYVLCGVPMRRRSAGLRGVMWLAITAGIVALPGILSAPYFLHDRVAPHAPSRFTLWANAAIAAAAMAAVAARARAFGTVLLAAAGGAAAVLAASLADSGMREAYAAAAEFAGGAGVVSLIDESKPLLRRPFPQPLLLLSGAFVLAPALPLSWSRADNGDRWLLGVFYALSLVLALMQSRFALVFAVPFCLALATTLAGGDWTRSVPRAKWLRGAAMVGAATMLFSLAVRHYDSPQRQLRHAFMRQMAQKLGPPPVGTARRCLLGPWNLGHELLLIAGQPVVAHNFTEHQDRKALIDADRFLFGDIATARAILASRNVGLVWIDARDHSDIAAHRAAIGTDAAPDLRDTAWLRLLLGDRQYAAKLGLRRSWASPMAVTIQPGGPNSPPITVPRDQLYIVVPQSLP